METIFDQFLLNLGRTASKPCYNNLGRPASKLCYKIWLCKFSIEDCCSTQV